MRRMIKYAVFLLAAQVLAACAGQNMMSLVHKHERPSGFSRAVTDLAHLHGASHARVQLAAQEREKVDTSAIWVKKDGLYQHRQSGLTCDLPGKDETRKLRKLMIYDKSGDDVACHYVDQGEGRVISYYATLFPRASEWEHLEAITKGMQEQFPGATYVQPGVKVASVGPTGKIVERSAYRIFVLGEIEGTFLHSSVWIAKVNGWHIKVRATYPAADSSINEIWALMLWIEQIETVYDYLNGGKYTFLDQEREAVHAD